MNMLFFLSNWLINIMLSRHNTERHVLTLGDPVHKIKFALQQWWQHCCSSQHLWPSAPSPWAGEEVGPAPCPACVAACRTHGRSSCGPARDGGAPCGQIGSRRPTRLEGKSPCVTRYDDVQSLAYFPLQEICTYNGPEFVSNLSAPA